MEATMLPGMLVRESEFQGGLTGACGPNALAMAECWAEQRYTGTLAVYQRMRAAGRCDPNGPATIGGLAAQAAADGFATSLLAYREPMPEAEWRGFLATHVGTQALVLEFANAQVLHDAISGLGENARNLKYHFILVTGWHPGGHSVPAGRDLPAGWWCADGDNFAAGDVLQFYPDEVLAAAQPCAALAIASRVPMTTPTPAPTPVTTPTPAPAPTSTTTTASAPTSGGPFTRQADGTAVDTQTGARLGVGFAQYVFAHDIRQHALCSETKYDDHQTFAPFDAGLVLHYDDRTHQVRDDFGGAVAFALWQSLGAARTQVTALQARVASAAEPTPAEQSATRLVQALKLALA